ncbi:unnamed protein product [Zymoseptoria tritici ST99CH_3D1]|nr:unnamed protein product [Zymoseptoria tritici ST99CH_3D1]
MPPSPPARRSTRGAAPAAPTSTTSFSLSSSRQDRNTRGGNAQTSATPRSLSSEDISEPPRRSQRAQLLQKEDSPGKSAEAIDDPDEEAIDEEEITRCICGHQDYPGPPLSEAFDNIPDAQSEDAGGLFILCDGCSVWQHGGCVGIVEESQSPDKYFCELCRPKQHSVHKDVNGQKYSLYLPLHPKASRKGSVSKHDDKAKKERDLAASRGSVDPTTGRRRGTMRSKEHDDEEEQLKRAIEESKRAADGGTGTGRRVGKRGRDDSSEDKHESKRQRTASMSVPSVTRTADFEDDTDGEGNPTTSKIKKAKAEAAQSARQVKQAEQEKERERARAEAANRRLDRARSRRNDEAELDDDGAEVAPSHHDSPPPPSSQPPSPPAPVEKVSHKKGPGKKPGKKLGNNQYTKRNLEQAASSPFGRKRGLQTQATTGSGDEGQDSANADTNGNGTSKTSPSAAENGNTNGNGTGRKFGRPKKNVVNGNGNGRTTINAGEEVEKTFTNMSLALNNMSAYIAKQQGELGLPAVASGVSPGSGGEESLSAGGAVQPPGGGGDGEGVHKVEVESKFEELSSAEMAVKLQENIARWQAEYGHLVS